MDIIKYDEIEGKIIEIKGQKVIIDSDVADLYGVETKYVNQAVRNNPEKFPIDYILTLEIEEKNELVKNFDRFVQLKHSSAKPKAFTERGLYMLATILKSPKATETTLAIIDTFTKVREFGQVVKQLTTAKENSPQQQKLMQRAGDLISELMEPEGLEANESEASIEINLAIVKFKYSVKNKKKSNPDSK